MLWLEMSRDDTHGGEGWGFTRALWSPTHKDDLARSTSAWWDCLLRVRAGDTILHLKKDGEIAFVGYSTAETDGHKTSERPPFPGVWGYATQFFRVYLKDFKPFPIPFELKDIFRKQEDAFRDYFLRNQAKQRGDKRLLFFVIQANRLQCQNGAYLSEVDQELQELLFRSFEMESEMEEREESHQAPLIDVKTREQIQEIRTRVGQNDFSQNVRRNYHHRCCFPGCPVEEDTFLIGSHIARWSDVPELRGNVGNGLCLCLMHDKAFELGFFTINTKLQILVNQSNIEVQKSAWVKRNLLPYHGQVLKHGQVAPLAEPLAHH